MTEIPEHLLQRSRERRAAITGGGDGGAGESDGGGASAASSAPATQSAATPAPSMPAHPAPVEEAPTTPPSPMVEAFKKRRKIPYWAMSVLAGLPIWAYVFVGTLTPPPAGDGPLTIGAELYTSSGCAGCHGAAGGGGVGPAFSGGAVYETWPDFADHFHWVRLGSAEWLSEVGDTYGANNTPVGGGMPGFGENLLSDGELASIILYEREALGGASPADAQLARLEEIATMLLEHPEMTFEEALSEVGSEGAGAAPGNDEGRPAGG